MEDHDAKNLDKTIDAAQQARLDDQDAEDAKVLEETIQAGEQSRQSLSERIRDRTADSQEKTRVTVAKIIIYLYAGTIVVTILYLIADALINKNNAFDNIFELIKVSVLTVVTFIIGYYYGTSQSNA